MKELIKKLEKRGLKLVVLMRPLVYKYAVNGNLFKTLKAIREYYF